MNPNDQAEQFPGSFSYILFGLDGGVVTRLDHGGDVEAVREWASVSKMAVALAFGIEHDWELHDFTESVGPRGATIANLLSHTSGLGLEEGDPVTAIATKRVYSNYAVDLAVAAIVGENDPANWLNDRVFRPTGMTETRLVGRASSGVIGTTEELARLGVAWLRPDLIARYLGDLDGIVPGFGRFTPCPWGIGPEIAGDKHHWMGDWPPASFGHFGQSGALLLLNAHEQIGLAATSTVPFGPWAVQAWPQWTSDLRRMALDS